MALSWDKVTWFPNGVNQGLTAFIGGAAGDHTVPGVLASDQIASVSAIAFTGGAPSAVTELAAEFTVAGDDTLNNDGGTNTTGMLVIVQLVLGHRED